MHTITVSTSFSYHVELISTGSGPSLLAEFYFGTKIVHLFRYKFQINFWGFNDEFLGFDLEMLFGAYIKNKL